MKPVREHNLGLVLRQVAEQGPRSRATLALETGLNKSTVSSLVADLIDAGLLRDSPVEEERPGKVGRPPQSVELHPGGPFVLGLEINVDYLAVWATDLAGVVRHRSFVTNDNRSASPEDVIGALARLVVIALDQPFAGSRQPMLATVAVPGLVDPSGELAVAPNLGWVDVPVAEILADRFHAHDLAVVVDNEANLAALGELWFGGHQDLDDFIHVSGEIGVGGGVVVGEELFRGVRGFAGEIGHVVVQPDGPHCRCGARGCLEQVAGQEAILRAAGLTGAVGTSLGQTRGSSVAELLARARAGDPDTLRAVAEAGRALGIGLSATVNIVDPSTVVLGGLYAALEPWLSKPLLEELAERAITHRWSPVRVLASRLGPDAAVRGAAGAVVKRVLSEPAAVFRATGRHVAPIPPRPG